MGCTSRACWFRPRLQKTNIHSPIRGEFNKSNISTVVVAVIISNTRLAAAPGNVLLSTKKSKLSKESVINVSQIITFDKSFLTERVNIHPSEIISQVDEGLRLVLKL